MINIIDLSECPLSSRAGTYGGNAGKNSISNQWNIASMNCLCHRITAMLKKVWKCLFIHSFPDKSD